MEDRVDSGRGRFRGDRCSPAGPLASEDWSPLVVPRHGRGQRANRFPEGPRSWKTEDVGLGPGCDRCLEPFL